MLNNPYLQYRQTQAETAEPGDLVLMLYRGAISFLQRSVAALKQGDQHVANANLLRAQAILMELYASLDSRAGDLATNLGRIYDYAYWRLVEANCQKDAAAAEEVLKILQELLPAWQEAVQRARQPQRNASSLRSFQPVAGSPAG